MRDALTRVAGLGFGGVPGVVGSLSLTGVTNIAVLVVNLAGGVAQARALGPEGRGDLTVALLWPTLIASVGMIGVREAIVYRAARDTSERSQVLATGLAVAVLQTLLLVAVARALLPIVLSGKPPQLLAETTFYLWFLPLFPLVQYPLAFFQGRMARGAFNVNLLFISASSTAALLALWLTGRMTVYGALAVSLLSWGCTACLCFGILFVKGGWTCRPSPRLAGTMVWFGVREQLGSVTTLVGQLRVDLLVVSLLVPAAALGVYAVAGSAALVAGLLPTAASVVLYPAFARQSASARPGALAQFLLAGGVLTLVAGPILLSLLPFAVPHVFGTAFQGAARLTAVLAIGYLVRGWNTMLSSIVRGIGRPFVSSAGQIVEFVSLGCLLIVLTPRFGTTGAAASVAVAAGGSFVCLLAAALVVMRLSVSKLIALWLVEVKRWRRLVAARHTAAEQRGS